MKIRNGFISNSSSSSFIIIIGTKQLNIPKMNSKILNIPQDFGGETEFGWEFNDYNDLGSRLNFAYIQAYSIANEGFAKWNKKKKCYDFIKNKNYLNLLEKVLKEILKIEIINYSISEDYNNEKTVYGYIDHQSAAVEGKNLEMFKSEDTLKRFLFSNDSKIHTSNDNCF